MARQVGVYEDPLTGKKEFFLKNYKNYNTLQKFYKYVYELEEKYYRLVAQTNGNLPTINKKEE